MVVSFACPECGNPVELPPHSAGRKARCAECLTLVEVPFLRRQPPPRRAGNARQWAWVAIAAASAVAATAVVAMIVSSNMRGERQRVFAQLVSQSVVDESQHDLDNAIRRLDAALALAGERGTASASQLEAAREHRSRLLSARQQARSNDLKRQAEADLTVAEALLAESNPDYSRVLELCEHALPAAQQALAGDGDDLEARARALAASIVRARGVVIEPVRGTLLFGHEAQSYAPLFTPALTHAMTAHGFIPQPQQSPLRRIWDQAAPYRLSTQVTESFSNSYLDSKLLTTRIDADFALRAGSQEIWKMRLTARTRVPSSRFSAFESGYLASATRRDPELEKRLREDAVASAVELLPGKLVTFPPWTPRGHTTR